MKKTLLLSLVCFICFFTIINSKGESCPDASEIKYYTYSGWLPPFPAYIKYDQPLPYPGWELIKYARDCFKYPFTLTRVLLVLKLNKEILNNNGIKKVICDYLDDQLIQNAFALTKKPITKKELKDFISDGWAVSQSIEDFKKNQVILTCRKPSLKHCDW